MRVHILALFAALVTVAASAQQSPKRRIIDVHMHAEAQDPRFGQSLKSPLTGQVFAASADDEAHIRESMALMEQVNVVKAVVSGSHHDATLRWRERAPEKVMIGYAVDDPADFDAAFVRREHAAGRLQVIGEVAVQYAGVRPDDPRMEPIYALAEELDIPVGLHMHPGPPGAPYPPFGMTQMRASTGRPLQLEEVLVRHPKLRLYVMHAGWPFLDDGGAAVQPSAGLRGARGDRLEPAAGGVPSLRAAAGGSRLRQADHVRVGPDGVAGHAGAGGQECGDSGIPECRAERRYFLQQCGAVLQVEGVSGNFCSPRQNIVGVLKREVPPLPLLAYGSLPVGRDDKELWQG
jgi:hypothetical protein